MTIAPAPDLTVWPLLEALRTSTATQLGAAQRPVCEFPIYAADHPFPADHCDCKCGDIGEFSGQGVAWVRFVSATSMLNLTGQQHVPRPCGGGELMVTVEIGVYRCAPVLDQEGNPPEPAAIDRYSTGQAKDVVALHRALHCNQWLSDNDTDWEITSIVNGGPLGGCASTTLTAQVMRLDCCPVILTINWAPDPDIMLAVQVTVTGYGSAGAWLDWGDGTSYTRVTRDNPTVSHTFAQPDDYRLTAVDAEERTAVVTTTVTVKDHTPRASAFLDSDDDWAVLLWLNEPADATTYHVTWGDDSTREQINGQTEDPRRVPPRPRVRHAYTQPGHWNIVITDGDSRRSTTLELDTGDIGVVFTFDQGPYQPRVVGLWMATDAVYEIDWGDGSASQTGRVLPSGRVNVLKSAPMTVGDHVFLLKEVIDGQVRRYTARRLVIPNQWDWQLVVWTAWRREQIDPHRRDQPPPQTIRVRANNARTPCSVDWGDGSALEVLPVGGILAHNYAMPMPATGCLLHIEETPDGLPPDAEKRVFSRLLGAPRYIGQPVLNARSFGAVDMDVAGIAGSSNSDWYQISWGDGGTVEDIGATGAWYPAHHTYGKAGQYTITVDAPGMATPITREITVIGYPSPLVNAVEDRAAQDPEHRTVLITVNNTDSGGPVIVYPGAGAEPVELPETGELSHRYEVEGGQPVTYHPLAISKTDPTAKGRKAVTVPFPTRPPATIEFTVRQYGADPFTAEVTVTTGDPGKQLVLDWGDGDMQEIAVGVAARHPYPAGTWKIVVYYDSGGESVDQTIEIPFPPAGDV